MGSPVWMLLISMEPGVCGGCPKILFLGFKRPGLDSVKISLPPNSQPDQPAESSSLWKLFSVAYGANADIQEKFEIVDTKKGKRRVSYGGASDEGHCGAYRNHGEGAIEVDERCSRCGT